MKRRRNVEFIWKAGSKQAGLNQFVQKHLKWKTSGCQMTLQNILKRKLSSYLEITESK